MSKNDDMVIAFIGVLFLVVIGVMMLLPKNYFTSSEFFRNSSFDNYMSKNLGDYDTSLAEVMQKSPTLMGVLNSDKDELLIAKRCYKYKELSLDTVIAKIDKYALGQGKVDVKCRTYRMVVSSFTQVQDVIITDIQKTRNEIGSPLKGSVYVMLCQVPFWANEYNELRIVNDTNRAEYGNNPVYNTKDRKPDGIPASLQKDKVLEGGTVFMYLAIFYGGYSKNNTPLGVDAMDGTVLVPGATPQGMSFFALEDADHVTKADICNMECPADANIKCGCGTMPSVPKLSKYGEAYYKLPYLPASELDKGMTYNPDLGNMIAPVNHPNIINPAGNLPMDRINEVLYQARCIDSASKTDKPSTFTTMYRINPTFQAFKADTFSSLSKP